MTLTVRALSRQTHNTHHESNKKILKQAERLIQQQHAVGSTEAWLAVPQWIFGQPVVDVHQAAGYVTAHLRKAGFTVDTVCPNPHADPNTLWLHITWQSALETAQKHERSKRNRAKRQERQKASGEKLLQHLHQAGSK